jgi:hypothetical protein
VPEVSMVSRVPGGAHTFESGGKHSESQGIGQSTLRKMQNRPPQGRGDGYLSEPQAQAEAGVVHSPQSKVHSHGCGVGT